MMLVRPMSFERRIKLANRLRRFSYEDTLRQYREYTASASLDTAAPSETIDVRYEDGQSCGCRFV